MDTTEVAYARFEAEKQHGTFIYEMRLIKLDLTSEFKFQRRWYYRNWEKIPDWKVSEEWNIADDKTFQHKLVQKRDIFKDYKLVESRGI
jgi:hypothetical protein